jgi:CheY-like chemotaxis protein
MGKKILLADDSITIQKVIELTFSDEDFEVVTVGNGRLAVEKIPEIRPDVVLCDIIMPEKDGYEVCEFIKKSPQFAQIPVLLLTGAFEPFDQERAARVGCDGFLAKPFEPETLIAKVKELLAKAGSRHAAPEPPAARPSSPPPLPPPPLPAATTPPRPFAAVSPVPTPFAPPEPATSQGTARFAAAPVAPPPPFSSPSAPPPPPAAADEAEMTFIPDEPFEDVEPAGFASGPPAVPPIEAVPIETSAPVPVEELVPMTAEEAEALRPAPVEDASSTVIFRTDSLPWSEAAPSLRPSETSTAAPPPTPEIPVFEEVVEEEIEVPAATVIQTEEASFRGAPAAATSFEAAAPSPAPPPLPVPTPAPVAQTPRAAAPPPPPPVPAPAPAVEASSFADVAAAIGQAEPPVPASVAAQMEVPVEMVSQIAQRVVAQVSEKVVERIAWEVIPDLAEALIKKEIERLKAELQQLG